MTEETLGRRIAAHRKEKGLTQDALAEQLGVTAQAVSKWENDQSCPDITQLPRLAKIFGISVDALLGVAEESMVLPASGVSEAPEEPHPETVHPPKMPARRTGVGIALWLVLTGVVLLASRLGVVLPLDSWEALGLTGLAVFGVFGLYPKVSLFRTGCALAGIYYLYVAMFQPAVTLNRELLLPVLLVFFGLGLLVDSLRGKRKPVGHLVYGGGTGSSFEATDTTFSCATTFGEEHRELTLASLKRGEATVAFGELSLDFQNCRVQDGTVYLALSCCFGELTVYIPRRWRLQCSNKSFLGQVREAGSCAEDADLCLQLDNSVAFGEITIRYI